MSSLKRKLEGITYYNSEYEVWTGVEMRLHRYIFVSNVKIKKKHRMKYGYIKQILK